MGIEDILEAGTLYLSSLKRKHGTVGAVFKLISAHQQHKKEFRQSVKHPYTYEVYETL